LTGNIPRVYWFTGLSGSGKSTIANQLSGELFEEGRPHAVLDGDNLRLGINRDLGFKLEDRTENTRRTAEIANLMCDAGLIVLVSLVSPMEADREMARQIIGSDRFELVFVDTPIEVCEKRDPKGLYLKARDGKIPNFTGINSPFEKPNNFNWKISTHQTDSPTQIQKLLEHLLG
jgi:bifunctional enzyme CysN/CysC